MAIYEPESFVLKNEKVLALRHLGPEHAEQNVEFITKLGKETNQTNQYKSQEHDLLKVRAGLLSALQSQNKLIVAAFNDEEIVGSFQIKKTSPTHPRTRHIGEFRMAILKEYWSLGLGSRFMEIMGEFSKEHGIFRLEARIRTNNEHGLNLYQKYGFEVEGTRKKAAYIEGKFFDEYYIAKLLSLDDTAGNTGS